MIVAIIQARMGSTRLPNKVLKKINNIPLIQYQITRLKRSNKIDKIVVATSTKNIDNEIEEFCISNNIDCFRDSESDVLGRYYRCAKFYKAEVIVRLTADCPLTDPNVVDNVLSTFFEKKVDYCSNTTPPETSMYPDGSDVEVFSYAALQKANSIISDLHFREHVTFQFWRDGLFKNAQITSVKDFSKYRITVDYSEDFKAIEKIISEIERLGIFGNLEEIINIIDRDKNIFELNKMHFFGEGWEKKPN